jgi:cytohesin
MKHLLLTTIAAVLMVGCGESSIHDAAYQGNIEAVKQHIAAGTDVDAKTDDGRTPLHFAAFPGQKEIAELLLANGADVNAKANNGGTPLHLAAFKSHKEIVELLITKGADVNAMDDGGHTPVDWAESVNEQGKHEGKNETVALLRKHGGKTGEELKAAGNPTEPVAEASQPEPPTTKAPDISIWEAAATGNIEAVKQHLAAGTDVNARHKSGGLTPLHFAAYYGHEEIVELLITKGANVNAKEEKGWTPLHFAAYYGHEEIVELLITKGANVNAKANDGRTPIDWAITQDNTETADLLRKHGAKSGAEDSIHIAARTGNHEAVKQHLVDGTDVNAKDNNGETPLDRAILRNDGKTIDLLRKHGGKTSEELK